MLTEGTISAIVTIPLGLAILALAGFFVFKATRPLQDSYDDHMPWWMGFGFAAAAGLPLIICPLIGMGLVGFSPDFLEYHHVTGSVQTIASRQIDQTTFFVATIDGAPYRIDDTRASLLKAGDPVSLECTKSFVYGSNDNGWVCNWG